MDFLVDPMDVSATCGGGCGFSCTCYDLEDCDCFGGSVKVVVPICVCKIGRCDKNCPNDCSVNACLGVKILSAPKTGRY